MTLYLQDADFTLLCGDALDELRTLPDGSVHCALTSPPFFGLRDYGTGSWEGGDGKCDHALPDKRAEPKYRYDTGGSQGLSAWSTRDVTVKEATNVCGKCGARRVDQQIGLEATPDEWVARLVAVFREVRRVLRDDGTLWVECGDSYASGGLGAGGTEKQASNVGANLPTAKKPPPGFKPKDLLGQPWLLAFALRADGWYLRQCIVWSKPNAMPESVRDRCTTAHSYVFLLSKKPRYFFDAEAIAEKYEGYDGRKKLEHAHAVNNSHGNYANMGTDQARWPNGVDGSRNARSVWTIPTSGFPEAHFATWPPALVERIIRAGTSERGVCPECGAPWVREVERTLENPGNRSNNGRYDGADPLRRGFEQRREVATTTLGWKPTCECAYPVESPYPLAGAPVPATVLDPFMGSGTTALVARKLGRRSIGVELNPDYCEMSARRLQQLSLLA